MQSDGPKEDTPTLRQRLHSATGDREAEAEAVADRAGGAVSADAAKDAVREAHGDIEPPHESAVSDNAQEHDLATTSDALAVDEHHEEHDS
jgi:hypothetical protein